MLKTISLLHNTFKPDVASLFVQRNEVVLDEDPPFVCGHLAREESRKKNMIF